MSFTRNYHITYTLLQGYKKLKTFTISLPQLHNKLKLTALHCQSITGNFVSFISSPKLRKTVTAADSLNTDLNKISQWAATWLVTFNPAKTEALLFSRKLNRPQHPPLYMQNHLISEIDAHKHLGLYFTNDCTWHNHINYIKEKAWHRLNIMRKLKFKLDRKSLETIYLTFIRPLLEYGVWRCNI